MLTCYLFVNHADRDAFLSIRLDLHGNIDQALKIRTLDEIRELQVQCRTIIVMPAEWSSLLELELPWLADRKAREAIPFALEDHLAQSLTQLHFAIDHAYYQNNTYLIAVTSKSLIQDWMDYLQSMDISYDAITLDWFALQANEAIVLEDRVLMNAESFKGALSLDIWASYPQEWAALLQWQTFSDSSPLKPMPLLTEHDELACQWIAQRLHKTKGMNLCQGDFQHDTSRTQVYRWYQWAGIAAGAWLFFFFSIHGALWMMRSHQNKQLDQQIAKSYHVFFPDAHQVISPKIRIMQLLKKNQTQHDVVLWSLMEKLSTAFAKNKHNGVTMLQDLQFQNQRLTITLLCDNFAALETIENDLRQAKVHVHQLSAATEAQQVVAKLELSL